MELELGDNLLEVFAALQELRDEVQHVLAFAFRERRRHAVDPAVADEAEHVLHLRLRDGAVRERDALVEDGERVAEAAVGLERDELERVVVRRRLHLVADAAQPRLDLAHGDAAEIEALAARLDGRRDLVRLGRREEEDDVLRRLLERLQ